MDLVVWLILGVVLAHLLLDIARWFLDSQRVAYEAIVSDKRIVVVDGKEGEQYDTIAYTERGAIIFDSAESLHYLAIKGNLIYLVEEEIE